MHAQNTSTHQESDLLDRIHVEPLLKNAVAHMVFWQLSEDPWNVKKNHPAFYGLWEETTRFVKIVENRRSVVAYKYPATCYRLCWTQHGVHI